MAELKKTSRGTGLNVKENKTFPEEPKALSPTYSLIPTLAGRKARQPLTPIQKTVRPLDNDMVKVKKSGDANGNTQGGSKTNLTQIVKKSKPVKIKSKTGENAHRHEGKPSASRAKAPETKANENVSESKKTTFSDQIVQTENSDVNLVTGDAPPPEYYEQLAETRREALDEALKENMELWEENEKLQDKIKDLEKQNNMLMQCVDSSKLEELHEALTYVN